jgi:hypothetical protein
MSWWLNEWTLPVTADKRILGLTIWSTDANRATAFMPGSQKDTDLTKGLFNPFIEDCGSSYSLKRHYKG